MVSPSVRQLAALLFLGLAGCFSSQTPVPDGGAKPADASSPVDATADQSSPDVGAADSPAQDAGAPDGDAGATADATESGGPSPDASGDAGPDGTTVDAGGAMIRVANTVQDLGSAIDFCVMPQGGTFGSPYLASVGVTGGLAYGEMSEYAGLPAANGFTVRVVPAGSSSCTGALAADVTAGPSQPSSPTTVVLGGLAGDGGGVPLALQAFSDDPASSVPDSGGSRFRVIHQAPGLGPADFQIGVTPYTVATQTGVPYGSTFRPATAASAGSDASAAPAPDSAGYVTPGFSSEQVTLVLSGVETTSFYVNANVSASVTALLVGTAGSAANPLGFVTCNESLPAAGHKTPCAFSAAAPVTVPVRVAHLAPDQGAIDVCAGIGPYSLPWSANLLSAAGVPGGASFLQITGDLTSIPAGTDFRIGFAPAGQPCATSPFLSLSSAVMFSELTLALFESQFSPSVNYLAYIFDTGWASNPTFAAVGAGNLAPQAGQTIDFFRTENGMSEMAIGGAQGPNHRIQVLELTPDTYDLRVADDTTHLTVVSKTGVTLAGGDTAYWWYFNQGSLTAGAMARCPLDQRSSDALTTCPD